MKKTLIILSALALSGSAFLIAQDRDAPRGDRRGAGSFISRMPLFKALGADEETGDITLPKDDAGWEKWKEAVKKLDTKPEGGDGKLSREEYFGQMRRRGGGEGGGQRGGGDRRRGGSDSATSDRPE